MKNIFFIVAFLAFVGCRDVNTKKGINRITKETVNLILDTDLGYGFDDVGSMAVMHALADSGQVNILGTISSNHYELSAPCIQIINRYFNRADIPIGAPKSEEGADISSNLSIKWTEVLAAKYPHRMETTSQAPDAVKIYREILSKTPDKSVTICSIGFFTNLRDLLLSKADEYSALAGKELIEKKVRRLVSMAGSFPEGREFNIFKDTPAARTIVSEWPTEIIFSGSEIGSSVITGKNIPELKIENSPVKDVYEICTTQSDHYAGMSWDQTAVLVAVKGYEPYYDIEQGQCTVAEDGSNTWETKADGKHFRLIEKMKPVAVANVIDHLMEHQPIN